MRAIAAVIVVVALAATGCSSDGSGDANAPTEAAAAAAGVCRVLVAFDHTVADKVNTASHQITEETDPAHARELLLDATDDIADANDFLPTRYQALSLPDEGDVGRIVSDASAATEAVRGQLDLIRAELTGGLQGEGPREILSAVFIDMEKVQSLAQPDQGDYADPALVAALDAEPNCEHTINR